MIIKDIEKRRINFLINVMITEKFALKSSLSVEDNIIPLYVVLIESLTQGSFPTASSHGPQRNWGSSLVSSPPPELSQHSA